MAVQESTAERCKRFQGKVQSSLNYVLAAAQSGTNFKTELMEGASELLDNTQHFMNAVTALVVTSGSDALELRDQVTAKRHELCAQLAELIRICDKMILSGEVPSEQETESFAATIIRLSKDLMETVQPLMERRKTAPHNTFSPHRAVATRNSLPDKRFNGSYNTISKSSGLSTSLDARMQSLPNGSFLRGDDKVDAAGYGNGDRETSAASSSFGTMPRSWKNRKLFRRPSGGNLFEVKQETKAEVIVPDVSGSQSRLRSNSQSEHAVKEKASEGVTIRPKSGSSAKQTALSSKKALSLSQPLLNQVRLQAGNDPSNAMLADPRKENLHRTISHTPNARQASLDLGSATTLPHPPRKRGLSQPVDPSSLPALPPKQRRPQTPGARNIIVSDLFANATPPLRGTYQSSQMRYPPSPELLARSPKSSPPLGGAHHQNLAKPGVMTQVRVESPDQWSSTDYSVTSSSNSSSVSSLSNNSTLTAATTPSRHSTTPVGFHSPGTAPRQPLSLAPYGPGAITPNRHSAITPLQSNVASPGGGGGDGAPPPKPYHPTLPPTRPQSAIVDLTSAMPPEKPPHPTLRKNRSSSIIPEELPPPAKPPRPKTLTNVDNPPPLPPKKKALLSYLQHFQGYHTPSEDLDYAPRIQLAALSEQMSTAGVGRPALLPPETNEASAAPTAAATTPETFRRTPVSRTRSVLGSELNIPPPLPVKTRRGSGVRRASTIRSNASTGSGRRDGTIKEELETPTFSLQEGQERAESPPQPPVGSSDSGVHTSSDQMSEDDVSQSSTPDVDTEQEPAVNLLYYSDVDYYLVFNEDAEGHSLLGGPVDALVAHAAADQKHESDRLYHEAFLLTYRTFIEPDALIEKLLERHDTFLEAGNDVICHATLSLLLRVVDEIKGSMDKGIMERLLDTVFRLLCDNELKLGQLLHNKLFENLKAKGLGIRLAREALANSKGPPPHEWNITRFRSRTVAQQLTAIDSAFYNAVEVHECLTWSCHQSEERCPTLTTFTEHFNNVSYWVRTRLLESEKKSERDKVMSKFIKVIEHLREMNNFNSMFALLAAMDCAAVNRMNWSKEAIKSLEEPRKIIDNLNGFKNYRDALESGGSPCIPYLGLYLQDLTFINIGNTNMLEDNKDCVNFAKRWRQFKVMCKIKQYQQHGYETVARDDDIIQYFNGFTDHIGEEELWERSMQLKPRGQS